MDTDTRARRYGFNPGSVLTIDDATTGEVAARAAVTTTLSGAAGGLTCLINAWRRNKVGTCVSVCQGRRVHGCVPACRRMHARGAVWMTLCLPTTICIA